MITIKKSTKLLIAIVIRCGGIALPFNPLMCAASSVEIDYTLTPIRSESPYVSIVALFEGTQKGETIIVFPHNWANGYQGKSLKNIKIETEDDKALDLTDTENPAEKKVFHTAKAKLSLSYEVHPDPDYPHDVHRAIIQKNLVHAPGYALFAIPILDEGQSYKVRWQGLPKEWQTLSSHGIDKEMTLKEYGNHFSPNVLQHALYIAGLSRIHKFEIKGYPVYVSLEGDFKAKDDELLDGLKKIVSSQRDFFSDYEFPFYFFSLISSQDPRSAGGTVLESCFTAYFPKEHEPKDYLILISHEHMHAWTGGKIRKDTLECLVYWWSEGFTEYYARLLLYRIKMLSLEDFTSEMNFLVRKYYMSSVKNEPNTAIDRDFWNNNDTEKLPYYRGFVFALWLDGLIKIKTNQKYSLDDVMKSLFLETQKTNEEFTPELFSRLVKNVLGEGIEAALKKYIDEGKTIDLSEIYSFIPLKEQEIYPFYLGFSQDDLVQKNEIKDLDSESEAYKAGLRENDVIEKRDPIFLDNPDQTISMTIKGKTIQFKPRGEIPLKIPQIMLTSLGEKKLIEKWFLVQ